MTFDLCQQSCRGRLAARHAAALRHEPFSRRLYKIILNLVHTAQACVTGPRLRPPRCLSSLWLLLRAQVTSSLHICFAAGNGPLLLSKKPAGDATGGPLSFDVLQLTLARHTLGNRLFQFIYLNRFNLYCLNVLLQYSSFQIIAYSVSSLSLDSIRNEQHQQPLLQLSKSFYLINLDVKICTGRRLSHITD